MRIMKAVIMAGGFGSRLRPLTDKLPKPMMPIIDKPILHYIVDRLVAGGIKDIAMTLGYMPESIISYFGDGSAYGAKIRYFIEDKPLGTAGGVKNASKFIDGPFLVMSGDAFTTIDINEMHAFHIARGAKVTMAVKTVDNPRGYGEVETDSNGKVLEFREKPKVYKTKLINMGIYIMEREVLDMIPRGKYDFSNDLFPRLLGDIYSYRSDCYWSDIGTLPSYYATNMDVAAAPAMFGYNI